MSIEQARIVLVEDDLELSSLVSDYLQSKQFQVIQVHEGLSAVDEIISHNPDIVILDLMLPGKDGITICREARFSYKGPILMLTASDDVFDQVTSLEIGADDYVQKPVEPRLLLARIRALLRRAGDQSHAATKQATVMRFHNMVINQSARQVTINDQAIELTTPEFDVLSILANHAGQVLSRDALFKQLKNFEYDGQSRFIDITISHIRKKLGEQGDRYLKTVRGQGYLLVVDS